jgi:hypothetical protein
MARPTLIVATWCLVSAASAVAQVRLEHKFLENSSFTTETTANFDQKLSIGGTDIDTSNETSATIRSQVGAREADGRIRVVQKIEAMKATVEVMGQTYTFDSANPDDKGSTPLEVYRPLHKAVASHATTIIFDKSNRPVQVENDADLLNSLPAEVREIANSQLNPEHLKNEAAEELDQIKSDGVNKGDTWLRVKSTDFGSGQIMDFKTEYTYQGTVEQGGKTLDKITTKVTDVTYALVNSTLPFGLKESELKPTESNGVILFDREQGHTTQATSSIRITGEITFDVNGKDLPATIDLKMKTGTTVRP